MKILVVGATGFIGRQIVAELLSAGHDVVGGARNITALSRMFPSLPSAQIDLTKLDPNLDLSGVEVLVNVAGLLNGSDLETVHVHGAEALYRAAAKAGVRRLVLISAISARQDVSTDYARTKLAGEEVLKNAGIPWTILRPSLIVAKGSYGGSSVLRGLAGLPLVTPVITGSDALFSPLHARDLAATVIRVTGSDDFIGRTLEPVGPQTLDVAGLVRVYRRWLGHAPAIEFRVPNWLVALTGRLGDALGGGPISTMSLDQIQAGNAGDGARFADEIGFTPRGLDAILRDEPADVADRWHARLFFLAIVVRALLVITWIVSAALGLAFGASMASGFVVAVGLPASFAWPLILVTSCIDLTVAAILIVPMWRRFAFPAQLAVSLAYTIGLTLVMPGLWLDPFGPLLKNLALMALICVDGVLAEPR